MTDFELSQAAKEALKRSALRRASENGSNRSILLKENSTSSVISLSEDLHPTERRRSPGDGSFRNLGRSPSMMGASFFKQIYSETETNRSPSVERPPSPSARR